MRPALRTVVACLAGVTVVVAVGCATEADDAFSPADPQPTEPDETGSADCPTEDPAEGAACTQPEGTTCAVGACGTSYVACRGGQWAVSPDAPVPHCPTTIVDGDDCPRCFPTTTVCGLGCAKDAGPSGTRAYCVSNDRGGLTWKVETRTCPTFDASAPDAEADAAN